MTFGRAGGCCVRLLDNGRTAFRTSLLLQKNDPLELSPGGVMGRSINLGFRGVLSSYVLLGRTSGGGDCGGCISKAATSVVISLARAVSAAAPVLVPLGSLFSIFLWKVSAAITVRSSSDISETCNSFMNAIN